MPENINIISEEKRQQYMQQLAAGDFRSVEQDVFSILGDTAASILEELMNDFHTSDQGREIVSKSRAVHNYREVKNRQVQITLLGEHKVSITSRWGSSEHKRPGRKKKGRNGTGTHILLKHWGFYRKRSPGSVSEITRCGVGSASYELAAEQLHSQGNPISTYGIQSLVMAVGEKANAYRKHNHLAIANDESLAGKRIGIYLDGGRVRSRLPKTGRLPKDHTHHGYKTEWREPKLLAIVHLDKHGNKQKGSKPVYEATMGSWDELSTILTGLCQQLHLSTAKEVVLLGDGAHKLWGVFDSLQKKLGITAVEIVDFFHAVEHITELTKAHRKKTESQQKVWAKELEALLAAGKVTKLIETVKTEGTNITDVNKHLAYFIYHQHRMHYDAYRKANLPIGSGIIESAVRQVINGRLKALGTFWKIENVEKMLSLRCALLSKRWDIFMGNFIREAGLVFGGG